ncbi:MAG: tetratricopeptide repeat protein [Selenomonadaceae bacterium]|nr:tetratricopeptide repeat protein [Selenomonadaceae bacterium]
MKKIFTCLLTFFFILSAVNFADAAKDKTEKNVKSEKTLKFDDKKLKKTQLTESTARDNPVFVMRGDLNQLTILGGATATQNQMVRFIKKNNPNAKLNCSIEDIVKIYYAEAETEGIRPDLAICQAIKETGFWNYGGDVDPKQNNFCGLGATGNKEPGAKFDTPQIGARAHLQHLLAYATKRPPRTAIVDPRYLLLAQYRQDVFGKIQNWTRLNGVWAVPGKNYGQDIIELWKRALMPDSNDTAFKAANIQVQKNSSNADAYVNRGLINFERGDFSAAEKDFIKASELEPYTADILFNLAIMQEKNKHFDDAIKTYDKFLAIELNSENGYYNRGRLKLAQNNFDGAIKDFEKVLELEDRFVDAQNEIAVAHFRQKNYEQALKDIRKAAEVNTTNKIINENKTKLEDCLKR